MPQLKKQHFSKPEKIVYGKNIFVHLKTCFMTRTEIEESVNELNRLIKNARFLDAFERYYDDDVVMQENEKEPMTGKAANREREKEFFGKTTGYENGRVEAVTVGDNTSAVVWSLDFKHEDFGQLRFKQVSVQQWENGKIIKEQFFYGN